MKPIFDGFCLQFISQCDIFLLRRKFIISIVQACIFTFRKNTGSVSVRLQRGNEFVSQQSEHVFLVRSFGCALFIFMKTKKTDDPGERE